MRKKCVFKKHQDLQMCGLNTNEKCSFHPYEVVGRGNETQLQIGENTNYVI